MPLNLNCPFRWYDQEQENGSQSNKYEIYQYIRNKKYNECPLGMYTATIRIDFEIQHSR